MAIFNLDYNALWESICKWCKKAGRTATRPVLLLWYVMCSKETPRKDKWAIFASLAYLILPIDILDAKTAQKFIDNLAIFSLLANVADVKSLVIHPATTTHSQSTEEELLDQGIKPNTIRLSIGIEKVEDLIAALDAAFEAVK